METWRPRDLAGMSSDTHSGVVAVLKPFPHPLITCQSMSSSRFGAKYSPHDATDNHLRNSKGSRLEGCADEHERSAYEEALPPAQPFAYQENIDSPAEATNPRSV